MTSSAKPHEFHETVVVRVSVVGAMGEGVGTHDVRVDLDTMTDQEIGSRMADAFRHALTPAIEEYGPKLGRRWADQVSRAHDTGG